MVALLTSSVSIELVYSSVSVTSIKFQKGGSVSERDLDPQNGPGIPGSDKKKQCSYRGVVLAMLSHLKLQFIVIVSDSDSV